MVDTTDIFQLITLASTGQIAGPVDPTAGYLSVGVGQESERGTTGVSKIATAYAGAGDIQFTDAAQRDR